MAPKISFLGAAREVTGSCFLVETGEVRFLIACGMFQGGREAPARNRKPFGFDPKSIDFVLLTHAHIDHSGLLPKLTKAGFTGPIFATEATADLLGVMLPDSAHIQESDARKHWRRSKRGAASSTEPIYTMNDVRLCLRQVHAIRYDTKLTPNENVRCRFRDAGHILGSAIIEVWISEGDGETTKIVFSGDLGQPGRPILRDPTPIPDADILVIESTYGNREHEDLSTTLDEMIEIVERTRHGDGGNIIVPAFAVGRTQEVLYHLHRLTCEGRLRDLMIFVGIAKLLDVDCKSGDFSQSGRHLGGITVPQAEGIGSGMTVGDGGKSIAAGAEDDADLVVGSKEPLRLPRRFEPSHDLFPSPRRPV